MAAAARRLALVRRHLPSVDSTNTYARAHLATFDPDAVTMVTADEQTAGRGRLGRVWKSVGKATDITATFTFKIPAETMPVAYQLSPLLSLADARALRSSCGVDAVIKWPNDIIVGSHNKVGGILCELEHVGGS